jgi:hypothetical protein
MLLAQRLTKTSAIADFLYIYSLCLAVPLTIGTSAGKLLQSKPPLVLTYMPAFPNSYTLLLSSSLA